MTSKVPRDGADAAGETATGTPGGAAATGGTADTQAWEGLALKKLAPENWLTVDPVCAAMVGLVDGRVHYPTGEERTFRAS
jgi:hypothetical protein